MNIFDGTFASYTKDELSCLLLDYYKAIYGVPPVDLSMFSSRRSIINMIKELDTLMEETQSTYEGREILRSAGWNISEPIKIY